MNVDAEEAQFPFEIVQRLRCYVRSWAESGKSYFFLNADLARAADEIERLRDEHRAACEDRDAYRARYLRSLAASVWKPGTKWKTYVNPQRSDGLFVATVGDLTRPYQAVPDRCLSLQCQLPHYDAQAVVRILNEWTESDARRAKEETTDER